MSTYDKLVGATSEGLRPPAVLEHIEPSVSPASTTFWVSETGDDNADGSEAAPFRTISKALTMIPELVRAGHVYTITIGAGTWDEIVALEHRVVYGQVIIQGASTDRSLHKVRAVRCDTIVGHLTIQNLTTTLKTVLGASFRFYRCTPMVEVLNVKSESDASVEKGVEGVIGLLADYGSQVIVRDSDFGGKRYGMRSNYLSRIFSRNNTGTNNTFGLGARWGGIMTTSGTQPGGDTALTTDSGGILSHDKGAKLGTTSEIGLLSALGHGDDSPVIKRYQLNSANTRLDSDLTSGQVIRVRFRAPNDGYVFFRVGYGGQTSITAAQGIERNMYGFIGRTRFLTSGATTVSDNNFGSRTISMVHTGAGGAVDLKVEPLAALAGRWGIDIEMSFHRALEAPALESVTLT